MPLEQSLHGLLRRQDRKGAGAVAGLSQLEHQVVATDQHIGMPCQREFQKHLVVGVAALGQRAHVRRDGCGHPRHARAVSVKHPLATARVELELPVAGHTCQFGQRLVVCQTNDRAGFKRGHQRGERWCSEVKQIHDHVGVEDQAGGRRGDGDV